MKKIVCVVGTRPQIIKHSSLLPRLRQCFDVTSINTLQHYSEELNNALQNDLNTVFDFINLPDTQSLNVAARLGRMIAEIALQLQSMNPDAVLVYGDTDSTLAGALAAQKLNIKLIHVEAGERSFNLSMPEEHNRVIVDSLSDVHFCASTIAFERLTKEKMFQQVFLCGDLMKDLAFSMAAQFKKPLYKEPYIFCTIHRNYNKQNITKLKDLLEAINRLTHKVFFPVHPATMLAIEEGNIAVDKYSNISILPPVTYSSSIHWQKFATAVVTDSGGIQKEAYYLKRPCITIRKETEWVETLVGNWNQLIYDDLSALSQLLANNPEESAYKQDLYGQGNAGKNIAEVLLRLL